MAKEHADILLKLPDYANWIAGAPQGAEKLYALVHAATWADDIKTKDDYYDDQVKDSKAKQIVPYGHLKHAYWHFKDALYTPDGTSLPQPDPVDAVTQLKALVAKLPASESAWDAMRSYSLAWTLHLVGDYTSRIMQLPVTLRNCPTMVAIAAVTQKTSYQPRERRSCFMLIGIACSAAIRQCSERSPTTRTNSTASKMSRQIPRRLRFSILPPWPKKASSWPSRMLMQLPYRMTRHRFN